MLSWVRFFLNFFVLSVVIFGIVIVGTWVLGHFWCPNLKISAGETGTALGGIATVIALYSGLQSYFDNKFKQQENVHIGQTINLLLRLRALVDALYSITSPFGQNEDPERAPDASWPEYMQELRRKRFQEYAELLKEIEKDSKEVDAFFNKEIINLYIEVNNKWREINLNFQMWNSTFGQEVYAAKNAEYWGRSMLTLTDHITLRGQITNIIQEINPNYNKKASDISFV